MTYVDRNFEIHRHDSDDSSSDVDAKVFGSGFVHISSWTMNKKDHKGRAASILIDPEDIEALELALKEAKRRRRASARRIRRKTALELAKSDLTL